MLTVKKLIAELEKIENKFLEVKVYVIGEKHLLVPVQSVRKVDKKALIFTEVVKKY